jgi:protein-tyrosine phosphatase
VLCHGNICRSPFAEALILRRRPDLVVSSAGLAAGEGAPADPAALRVAKEFGVDLSGHRSRAIDPASLAAADLVLVMEASQALALRERSPAAAQRTRLLGDFLHARPFHIADPWGHPEEVFASTFARIASAVQRLGARLEAARQ